MALETWHAYFLGPGVPGRQVLICPVGRDGGRAWACCTQQPGGDPSRVERARLLA